MAGSRGLLLSFGELRRALHGRKIGQIPPPLNPCKPRPAAVSRA